MNLTKTDSHQGLNSAFLNPNLRSLVLKTVSSILAGQRIKDNQQRLNKLRTEPQYHLVLCQLVAMLHKQSLIEQNSFETNKKKFILLEIKKNVKNLKNEQCWWLLRDVYFSDNDMTAKFIREICFSFEKQVNQDVNQNFLKIFFMINLENIGLVGIMRYLTLSHGLITSQIKSLQNRAVMNYGQQIVIKIKEFIEWDLPTYVLEFSMTILIMVQGFLVDRQCWGDRQKWKEILDLISENRNRVLTRSLAKYLKKELHIQDQKEDQQISQRGQQFLQAVKQCLNSTRNCQPHQFERSFYFDSLVILHQGWKKDLREIFQRNKNHLYHQLISELIFMYSEEFRHQSKKENKNQLVFQQEDEDEKNLIEKRLAILMTTFQLIPRDTITEILSHQGSYLIEIMHLSTYCESINTQFLHKEAILFCLDQLSSALYQQSDAYLFYTQKSQFIDIITQYIARYYQSFDGEITIKACYMLDLLAFKCDTVAEECYEMLKMIVEENMSWVYDSDIVEFVETSLTHVNDNEWQQSHTCYSHIIKILLNLNPYSIFNHSSQTNRTSIFLSAQNFFPLQKQILQMIKTIISTQRQSFNYESMHQLNLIIQHLLNHAPHLIKTLTYQDFHFITQTNFQYEILTPEAAEIYFHYCQFTQQKDIFINSVNMYHFWQMCQSQKLNFFVHVYLKFIQPKNHFFTSSETEHKLNQLKKNLWHRFVSQNDQDQRYKIVEVFEKHPNELSSLFQEFHKIQLWRQIKNQYHSQDQRYHSSSYSPPKMELQ